MLIYAPAQKFAESKSYLCPVFSGKFLVSSYVVALVLVGLNRSNFSLRSLNLSLKSPKKEKGKKCHVCRIFFALMTWLGRPLKYFVDPNVLVKVMKWLNSQSYRVKLNLQFPHFLIIPRFHDKCWWVQLPSLSTCSMSISILSPIAGKSLENM